MTTVEPLPKSNWVFNLVMSLSILTIMGAIAVPNLLRSRMAPNESAAIGACKTFLSSEQTYKRVDYDNNGVLEYAKTLKELYGDGKINLVDKAFANAEYSPTATPKANYFFKVLTSQGPGAKGGAMSYIDEKGQMTKGFALLAMPSSWDCSGRNCFMVSHHGIVYQKDLGTASETLGTSFNVFDPTGWIAAE